MLMGRSKNINCQVIETRHKGIKIKAIKSNRKPDAMGGLEYYEPRGKGLSFTITSLMHGPAWAMWRHRECDSLATVTMTDNLNGSSCRDEPRTGNLWKAQAYY